MLDEKDFLIVIRNKYAKNVIVVALLVSIFALAGIFGTIIIYQQQKSDNYKVNISGRQRFLSAMVLIDLERHIENKKSQKLLKVIEMERNLLSSGIEILGFHNEKIITGVKKSTFAIENTPDVVNIYQETIDFLTATNPEVGKVEERIAEIKEKQRQVIAPVWDASTGQLAGYNDHLYYRLMIFIVFCFGLVIFLNIYAIIKIVLPLMTEIKQTLEIAAKSEQENFENKNILKISSKFVTLGEQVANINHDMNNMLAIISAFIPSFKGMIADRPDQLKRFTVLEKSVERLLALTSSLRRSIIGNENTKEENFKIIDIAIDCKTILNDKLKTHAVQLNLNIKEGLTITLRKDYLYQLLLNLLANSIEAVSKTENAWVKIEAEENNEEIVIRIIDSGKGLPLEVKEKLFKPFYTTKESGSGLGLNYMRKMIEGIGGQLFYDDSFENTCFTLKIPLQSNKQKS